MTSAAEHYAESERLIAESYSTDSNYNDKRLNLERAKAHALLAQAGASLLTRLPHSAELADMIDHVTGAAG